MKDEIQKIQSKSKQIKKSQQEKFSPEAIMQLLNQPELRLSDYPPNILIAQQLMLNPQDHELAELFEMNIRSQVWQATISGDPYWPNYPPPHNMPAAPTDAIWIGLMPNNAPIWLSISRLPCNLVVFGRTGAGKSSFLKHLVREILTCI